MSITLTRTIDSATLTVKEGSIGDSFTGNLDIIRHSLHNENQNYNRYDVAGSNLANYQGGTLTMNLIHDDYDELLTFLKSSLGMKHTFYGPLRWHENWSVVGDPATTCLENLTPDTLTAVLMSYSAIDQHVSSSDDCYWQVELEFIVEKMIV